MPSNHSKRRRRDKAVLDISVLDDIPLLTKAEARRLVLSDFNHAAGIQREIALVPKSGTRLERAETQALAVVEAWDESASESGLHITGTGAEEFYPDTRPERLIYILAKDILSSVEKLRQKKADGDIDAAIERAIDIGRDAAIIERWTANALIAQTNKNRAALREGNEREYGTPVKKKELRKKYQVEVDRLMKKGHSHWRASNLAAKKFKEGEKTIYRHTEPLEKTR